MRRVGVPMIKAIFTLSIMVLVLSDTAWALPSDEIKECYEHYDMDFRGKMIHGQDIMIDCVISYLDRYNRIKRQGSICDSKNLNETGKPCECVEDKKS
jgi:hypothetical protein